MDDLNKHIGKLREDFTKGQLDEKDVCKLPSKQFEIWFKEAYDAKVPEVQAMHLSTVSTEGKPSSRIVYLREYSENKFWFYTNYESKKSKELNKNPYACVTFFWPELERQIRIEGSVSLAGSEYSDAYFNNRPYESQIGAWASQQSSELKSRSELENKLEELKAKMPPDSVKRPPFWGGYILEANYYEFWQGRKSRLHDRISYEWKNNVWQIKRLAP